MPGNLPPEVLPSLLSALPVDITFADKDDIIRYYSDYRIFKRTPEILGTPVIACHLPASHRAVRELIDDLKSGRRDVVQMWADKDGRRVSVRYIACRDKAGEYSGLVEAVEWEPEQRDRE